MKPIELVGGLPFRQLLNVWLKLRNPAESDSLSAIRRHVEPSRGLVRTVVTWTPPKPLGILRVFDPSATGRWWPSVLILPYSPPRFGPISIQGHQVAAGVMYDSDLGSHGVFIAEDWISAMLQILTDELDERSKIRGIDNFRLLEKFRADCLESTERGSGEVIHTEARRIDWEIAACWRDWEIQKLQWGERALDLERRIGSSITVKTMQRRSKHLGLRYLAPGF